MKTIEYGHERWCHVYVNAGCTCRARDRAAFGVARRLAADVVEQSIDGLDLSEYSDEDRASIRAAARDLVERLRAGPID